MAPTDLKHILAAATLHEYAEAAGLIVIVIIVGRRRCILPLLCCIACGAGQGHCLGIDTSGRIENPLAVVNDLTVAAAGDSA